MLQVAPDARRGRAERLITGDAPTRAVRRFCRILPLCAGSPVLHWAHFELKRIFGIDASHQCRNGAPRIWDQANERFAGMDTWSFLSQARVEVACTTDDPADDLASARGPRQSTSRPRCCRLPPDKAMRIEAPGFLGYLEQLGGAANVSITSFAALVRALEARIDYFHARGGRASDHAIDIALPDTLPDAAAVKALFAAASRGETLTLNDAGACNAALLLHLGAPMPQGLGDVLPHRRAPQRRTAARCRHRHRLRLRHHRRDEHGGSPGAPAGRAGPRRPAAQDHAVLHEPRHEPGADGDDRLFPSGKIPGKLNSVRPGGSTTPKTATSTRPPLTHNFCESCNRVRVTCTGTLHVPRTGRRGGFARAVAPLAIRLGPIAAIREAIARKPRGHDFVIERAATRRHMSATGG